MFTERSGGATAGLESRSAISAAVVLSIFSALNLGFFAWRLWIRYPHRARFSWDDALITIATILSIGQCATLGVALRIGLGVRSADLSIETVARLHQILFAGDVLYVLASGFAKLACAALAYRLARPIKSIKPIRVVFVFLAVWVLMSVLVVTVPAGSVQLWQVGPQISQTLFTRWIGATATNMIFECIILALPLYLLWGIHASFLHKGIFLGVCSSRCCVLIFAGLRLSALRSGLLSNDYARDMAQAALFTQLEMHLSIITATLPILPFFTEVLAADDSHALIAAMRRNDSIRSKQSHDSKYWETGSELAYTNSGIYKPTSGSVTTSIRKGSLDSCNLTGMFIHKETTYQTVSEEYQQQPEMPALPRTSTSQQASKRCSLASTRTILHSSTPSTDHPKIVLTRS